MTAVGGGLRNSRGRSRAGRTSAAIGIPAVILALPAAVSAHGLSPVYQSPLPLAVYLLAGRIFTP